MRKLNDNKLCHIYYHGTMLCIPPDVRNEKKKRENPVQACIEHYVQTANKYDVGGMS